MAFYLYLARCSDRWSCRDLQARETKHNQGDGALYTKMRRPVSIIYSEEFCTQLEAVKREYQIKKWTRVKKENLVKYGHPTKF